MSIRLFKSIAKLCVAALGAVALQAAAADAYELGTHYKQVREVQTPADPKRITVEEFFWYGCPHCFKLDPELATWLQKKPADVDFVRVPNTLGRPEGEVHARAFYIAQTLGIGDKIHKPLFDAINVRHYPMNSLDSIRALFVEVSGIKPADFDGVASSFVVDSGMRRAEQSARAYAITSVPTIVIGGKYMVAGQADEMKVVDFVIEKIRKERKGG
ncbi:MAG: thiol:disulfide interchange protein DsbA/DsbL [Nevskia sp.]|jgi:thiol:disulfide interchange protein DsbA|nr:thiol:disulfide interchange protein DsbA/DsbL [Nevskia sp.]MCK9386392.1 thiol:disulfide interchange protein DsbA/DsbL [Nevskia sp.]